MGVSGGEGREEEEETKSNEITVVQLSYAEDIYSFSLFALMIPLPCQKLRVEIIERSGNNA